MFELSKQFRFEAAHTLHRVVDSEPSRRVHGHSYRAEVVIRGRPDPVSGMLLGESGGLDLATAGGQAAGAGPGDGVSRQHRRYLRLPRN